ncbi:MAG: hypothetical protein ABFD16_03070 [Thermoguttaceae bacterium]|jgi:hypothetical protein
MDATSSNRKYSLGQAISFGLLVACLILLLTLSLYLARAQADFQSVFADTDAELPAATLLLLSFTPAIVMVLAGLVATGLTIKEILIRNTAIKLVLNLIVAVATGLLFVFVVLALRVPVYP